MRSLAAIFCLALAVVPAQPQTSSDDQAKTIERQIKTLRSLPDDTRADATRRLALQIRALPPGPKLSLAIALSNLATEGDFGRETLQEVAATLAKAIRESKADARAYAALARLIHYEHIKVSFEDTQLDSALEQLKTDDRVRQDADFTLTDLDGKPWALKTLRGKVVLVNFWATWCPPCRKEMPDLEKLSQRFRDRGLVVLAISDEDRTKVTPFIEESKYTYPILLDPGRKVTDRFHVQGIPNTLVYDRDGKLVAQAADMRTLNQFLAMLKQAGLQE
jgi:peroxiredoxin